ncbi:MAG: tetratricopeptide repeat protein [Reyranella sp.]
MQLTSKIAIGAGVVVCAMAAIYGYAYYKYPPRRAEPTPVAAATPAPATPAPAAPAPAAQTPAAQTPTAQTPAPAVPPAAEAAATPPTTRMFYQRCVEGPFPTPEDAERRNADCSRAIIGRELTPDELALARLVRGSARAALGEKVMASDDYLEALRRYDSLIDSQNADALNLFRRAVASDAVGKTDKALDDFNQAIRLDPQATLAFLGRGVLLATRKRSYERAIADFNKVLALEPTNVLALIRRGEAFSQLGESGHGLADLDRAVALAPTSSEAYFQRGVIHSRRNETVAALADYTAALERNPRNVEALTSRAAIHSVDRKFDLAIRDLDAAVIIDRHNPVAFFNRGYTRFALAEYPKAIADYTSAIALEPGFGLAYNNRCLARAIAGQDLLQALADCDTALKLMPANLDVRDTRGFIYLKLGDPALALNEYEAALQIDPNRAAALFGRGLARIGMGDAKGGEGDQAAARTLNPEVDQQFAFYGLK